MVIRETVGFRDHQHRAIVVSYEKYRVLNEKNSSLSSENLKFVNPLMKLINNVVIVHLKQIILSFRTTRGVLKLENIIS